MMTKWCTMVDEGVIQTQQSKDDVGMHRRQAQQKEVRAEHTIRASSRLPVRPGSESASSRDVLRMRWLSRPRYLQAISASFS